MGVAGRIGGSTAASRAGTAAAPVNKVTETLERLATAQVGAGCQGCWREGFCELRLPVTVMVELLCVGAAEFLDVYAQVHRCSPPALTWHMAHGGRAAPTLMHRCGSCSRWTRRGRPQALSGCPPRQRTTSWPPADCPPCPQPHAAFGTRHHEGRCARHRRPGRRQRRWAGWGSARARGQGRSVWQYMRRSRPRWRRRRRRREAPVACMSRGLRLYAWGRFRQTPAPCHGLSAQGEGHADALGQGHHHRTHAYHQVGVNLLISCMCAVAQGFELCSDVASAAP